MRNLECFIENYKETEVKKVQPEELEHLESILECLFMWSLVWSVGCTTDLNGRIKMDGFLRELMRQKKITNPIPEKGTIYDYEFK